MPDDVHEEQHVQREERLMRRECRLAVHEFHPVYPNYPAVCSSTPTGGVAGREFIARGCNDCCEAGLRATREYACDRVP